MYGHRKGLNGHPDGVYEDPSPFILGVDIVLGRAYFLPVLTFSKDRNLSFFLGILGGVRR